MRISKRKKIGVVLILVSAVASIIIPLVTGDLVSITHTGNGTKFVIEVHDIALVLAVPALIGLACLIIPPRDNPNA